MTQPREEIAHPACRLVKQQRSGGTGQPHEESLYDDGLPLADVQPAHQPQQALQARVVALKTAGGGCHERAVVGNGT